MGSQITTSNLTMYRKTNGVNPLVRVTEKSVEVRPDGSTWSVIDIPLTKEMKGTTKKVFTEKNHKYTLWIRRRHKSSFTTFLLQVQSTVDINQPDHVEAGWLSISRCLGYRDKEKFLTELQKDMFNWGFQTALDPKPDSKSDAKSQRKQPPIHHGQVL